MQDRPAKRVLYIFVILLAIGVAFVNPWHTGVTVLASGICLIFVAMYIHSDRKREQERQKRSPVTPAHRQSDHEPPDASASV